LGRFPLSPSTDEGSHYPDEEGQSMNKALFFTALGKTALVSSAWAIFNLTLLDVIFIMFSVDIITMIIAQWLWKDK
jgi:hypothetical protein